MNPEIIKAMNRKNEKHPIRDWWHKNGYKVMRIVLFPVWAVVYIEDKVYNKIMNRQKWDENRACDILNYYIPRRAVWNEEDKSFHFFDNGMGWYIGSAKRYLKFKDRRFGSVSNIVLKFICGILLNWKALPKSLAIARMVGLKFISI